MWRHFIVILMVLQLSSFFRPYYEARWAIEAPKHHLEQDRFVQALPGLIEALRWRAPLVAHRNLLKTPLVNAHLIVSVANQLLALRGLRQGITASRSWLTIKSDRELLIRIEQSERALVGEPKIQELNKPQWNVEYQLLAQLALWSWLFFATMSVWRGLRVMDQLWRGHSFRI